jgi:hypothetical protein
MSRESIRVIGSQVISDTAGSREREIFISTSTPPSGSGKNGDIWLKYS